MVTIKNSQALGKLDERFIEEIESLISYRLPQDYREFLLAHNGGYPDEEKYVFVRSYEYILFDSFRGFRPGLSRAEVAEELRDYAEIEIPARFLRIANTHGGFCLQLSLDDPDKGSIYLDDPIFAECEPLEDSLSGLAFVCRGFTELLNKLIAREEVDRQMRIEFLCRDGKLDEIEQIIANATDINIRDELGRPLIQLAAQHNHRKLVEKLVQQGANINGVLLEATKLEDFGFAMFALSHGADTEERDYYLGYTPLMVAVARRFFNMSRILIEHGANVNAQGRCGETPLVMAQGNEALCALLIASGAK